MGRYCRGDIDHKLWFTYQRSDAASRFGGDLEPNYILYEYWGMEEFDLEAFDELIKEFNILFNENASRETCPETFFYEKKEGELLNRRGKWGKDDRYEKYMYIAADFQLGLRIYNHILKFGKCCFKAEL